MHNDTRFAITEQHSGIGRADVPSVFRLRQHFERPVEEDVAGAVRREIAPFVKQISPGQQIAITGSSRGIANLQLVVAEAVAALKEAGAEPFVVPGMGSHGGATADGQVQVLADTNLISETSVGCPIRSSMETVQVGTTASGFPVYQDKHCHDADGVLVKIHGTGGPARVGLQWVDATMKYDSGQREFKPLETSGRLTPLTAAVTLMSKK